MPMPAKNWHLTGCFGKGSATEVGALQVQKWTTWDKPRLPSSVGDELGKDCTNGSMSRELNSVVVERDKLQPR